MSVIKKLLNVIIIFVFGVVNLLAVQVDTVVAKIPERVRVGLITENPSSQYRNASIVTFTVKGNYKLMDISTKPAEEVIGTPQEGEQWQIYYLSGGLQIYKAGESVKITPGPLALKEEKHDEENRVCLLSYTTNGSSVKIGKWYRGDMEFFSKGNSIIAVNELPMDEYLFGVVPREMSNSWPLEALKAQAVAARTYTVANINKRIVEGYNLLDTPADQAYGGFNFEGTNSNRAVEETSGEIILYDGKPISAVYHSSSGGHTEDNENVWSGPRLPYLRGKQDPYSKVNGFANWTYTATLDEIKNKLLENGLNIIDIKSLELDKYPSGRVKKVIITDSDGNTVEMSGSEFGKVFNPNFYTYKNVNSFMSNFFDVNMSDVLVPEFYVLSKFEKTEGEEVYSLVKGQELYGISDSGVIDLLNGNKSEFYIIDENGNFSLNKAPGGKIVFEGHGWGHGVGMSQWGAYEMAKQGKNYKDILEFYYTDVEVTSDY